MYKLKHENCACCGGKKQAKNRQYCDDCRTRLQRITESMPIANKVELVQIDLAIRDKAREQAQETIKKAEEKNTADKCLTCWVGTKVSSTEVFCFVPGMCHKSGDYRIGRTT